MFSLRPAIAMIELIFALLIMGIVMMSAPMLISTSTQSSTVTLQQEGIHEAVSRVSMIMTYPWDENDTNNSCAIPPVLHVTGGDPLLNEAQNQRRAGVPVESNSRTFRCGNEEFDAAVPIALGPDNGDQDDIDDFIGNINLVNVAGGAGGQDYLETNTVQINTAVAYVTDTLAPPGYNGANIVYNAPINPPAVAGTTSNIKNITVTLTSTAVADQMLQEKNIVLRAFSCNIGGREFEKRVMP